MSNLLTYALIVYVTVVAVKVVTSPTWEKETIVSALKWPYNLFLSVISKVKGI